MKKAIVGITLCVILITSGIALLFPSAAAPEENRELINQGFESGDLNGWALYRPSGFYGSAGVHTSYYLSYIQNRYLYPAEDDYFARITAGHSSIFTTLRQTFTLSAGASIEGWAAFKAVDYVPYNDNAAVQIFTLSNAMIAQVWYHDITSWTPIGVGSYGFADWEKWSWTAPVTGTYILQYGCRNNRDFAVSSIGFFDMEEGTAKTCNFEPTSLNLESDGNYVNTKVETFPDNPEYTPHDVDASSVSVAGVGADLKFGTWNNNRFIGKADRLMVEDAIGGPGDEVEVMISGSLNDGTSFKGIAVIKAL